MATLESTIGNTPLVELNRIAKLAPGVRLFVKLEGNNPGGSVKDRAALRMIQGAETRGELGEGIRIIEPTSGNTGIALAMIAARKGIGLTLVMPESMTVERRSVMAAYGAEFVLTSAERGMEGAIDKAREMVAKGEGIMLDQFSNDDNWRAHYENTGPEIWRQTKRRITHFVSAMGTTGTIMGVSRALKERNPAIRIIGVHPDETSQIAGIRRWPKEYLPRIFDESRTDLVLDVSADEAVETTRRLAKEEGIFCGVSSGGAAAAAIRFAEGLPEREAIVVVILPDRGDRYLSTDLFSREE
ncbi:cysteine synthase CysM [Magnetococcales bacterium HHB-1]